MHLSYSQASMWSRCQAQWMFRYIEKLKIPPPGPMAFGIAFDDGLSGNYEQKINTEKDLSISDTTDIFLESFDKIKLEADWQGSSPDEFRVSGIDLTKLHLMDFAPTIIPETVQEKTEIKFSDDFTIIAVTDIVTRAGDIVDIKTTGKSPSKDKKTGSYVLSPTHSDQGLTYTWAYKASRKRDPFGLQFLYHVRTKTPKIVSVKKITTPEEEAFIVDQFNRIHKQIESSKRDNLFIPNRSQMMCSKKQCGYWDVCHDRFGPTCKTKEGKLAESFVA